MPTSAARSSPALPRRVATRPVPGSWTPCRAGSSSGASTSTASHVSCAKRRGSAPTGSGPTADPIRPDGRSAGRARREVPVGRPGFACRAPAIDFRCLSTVPAPLRLLARLPRAPSADRAARRIQAGAYYRERGRTRGMRALRRLTGLLAAWGLVCVVAPSTALAQETAPLEPTLAFVNVNLVTMVDDQVRRDHVVLVRRDRIVAVGARNQVPVPADAIVIDGHGGYLIPGLTDAHVHLDGDGTRRGTSRGAFGDGPLYLAHGVTTVINQRGLPVHLEWREGVRTGRIVGPTIYTAGEFVNEPRVQTPADVEREIAEQAASGYDLIKFHEVYTRETGFLTTEGLEADT